MPATSGILSSTKTSLSPFRARRWDLLSVHDQALAENRVQRPLGDARPTRVVLDEVAEELVVALDRRRVGILEPVRALQPPVGRVERVRVMRAPQETAGPFELELELVLTVYAYVRARGVVVPMVDRPRDPLGPARRNRRRDAAAGPQDADDLHERALVAPDVPAHFGDDHRV